MVQYSLGRKWKWQVGRWALILFQNNLFYLNSKWIAYGWLNHSFNYWLVWTIVASFFIMRTKRRERAYAPIIRRLHFSHVLVHKLLTRVFGTLVVELSKDFRLSSSYWKNSLEVLCGICHLLLAETAKPVSASGYNVVKLKHPPLVRLKLRFTAN